MSVDERIERSRLLYERALFEGDGGGLAEAERELEGVAADLALAQGRIIHGRFFFHKAQNRHAGVSVQRGGRFIHNQNVRLVDNGSGNRDALLSPAQLHGVQFGTAFQSHNLEIFLGFLD